MTLLSSCYSSQVQINMSQSLKTFSDGKFIYLNWECSTSKIITIFLCQSSDEDLIFSEQASMGIKNDLQKDKEKKTFNKSNT